MIEWIPSEAGAGEEGNLDMVWYSFCNFVECRVLYYVLHTIYLLYYVELRNAYLRRVKPRASRQPSLEPLLHWKGDPPSKGEGKEKRERENCTRKSVEQIGGLKGLME